MNYLLSFFENNLFSASPEMKIIFGVIIFVLIVFLVKRLVYIFFILIVIMIFLCKFDPELSKRLFGEKIYSNVNNVIELALSKFGAKEWQKSNDQNQIVEKK